MGKHDEALHPDQRISAVGAGLKCCAEYGLVVAAESQKIPLGVMALFASKFCVTIAIGIQVTIVGKQVWDLSGSKWQLGLIGLTEFVPTALLSPFTGAFADRYDRRKVLAAGLLGELVAAFLLFAYATTDPTTVFPIYGFVLIFGIARAFVAPPSRALPFDLAPDQLIERVAAINALTFQIALIIGPVIGGFLYVVSPAHPYLFATIMIVIGIAVLAFVPYSPREVLHSASGVKATLVDAREGLRFVRRTPVLFGAISLDLFAVLFGGAVALLPAIAEERLGVGAIGLGWLRAATGMGAASVSLALAAKPVSRHLGRVLLVAVAVFGLATIVLGLTTSFTVAFIALLILSGSDSISMFIRSAIVPMATPESMRGRVLATENVFIGASNELGAFESGVAASLIGLVGAVVFGGAATLAVVVLWWRFFPALRLIDRFSELKPVSVAPDVLNPVRESQ